MAPHRVQLTIHHARLALITLLTPTASYLIMECCFATKKMSAGTAAAPSHWLRAWSYSSFKRQPVSFSADSASPNPEGESGCLTSKAPQLKPRPEPTQARGGTGTPTRFPLSRCGAPIHEHENKWNRLPRTPEMPSCVPTPRSRPKNEQPRTKETDKYCICVTGATRDARTEHALTMARSAARPYPPDLNAAEEKDAAGRQTACGKPDVPKIGLNMT
ncbi:hypothetical protein NDU88_008066 [Pleurodeles waltl]|uniref:Secreted protein n=1 Tax=Pleurodeles waltl TaxID=8319 RepID=A0AAV7QTH2_PLEWA|nr:hypothetical protein NDU88_008066 [Pleurodeles waltl]